MTTRNPRLEAVVSLRDEASRALKGLTAQTRKFKNEIRATGVAMAAMGVGILGLAGVTIKMASSLEESMNAVSVVFKSGAKDIIDFAKTASTQVGLTANDFQQMATLTGALLRDVGLSEAEVAQETIKLAKRAADMASVFDTDVKDALFAINAAIRGETEPIRRFAGDVTDATLQITALALGITKSVTAMSEQEKRLLRIETIMRQTSDTQGDWLNTADSFANASKRVTAQIKDQAAVIGSILLPVAKQLVGIIATIVTKVVKWSKENPELFATIVKVTVAIGLALAVLGPLLVMLPFIISGIAALGVVIGALLGPIGLVVLAVAAFATAYATNFLGIRDITNTVVKSVIEQYESWAGWLLPGGALIKGILLLKNSWREMTDFISQAIEDKVNEVIGTFRDLVKVMADVARFLNLDMAEGLDNFVEKINDVDFATKKVVDGVMKRLRKGIKEQAEAIREAEEETAKLAAAIAPGLKDPMEDVAKATETWRGKLHNMNQEILFLGGVIDAGIPRIKSMTNTVFDMSDATDRAARVIRDLKVEIEDTIEEALTPFEELLSEVPGLLDAFSSGMIDASQAAMILAGQTGMVTEALVEQVGKITTLQDKWETFIKATKGADQFSGAIAGQFNLGPPGRDPSGPSSSRRTGGLRPVFNPRFSQGAPSADAVVVDDQGNVIKPPRNTEQTGASFDINLSESLDTGMGKMVSE